MRCVKCRAENPQGTNFCGYCGSPLPGRQGVDEINTPSAQDADSIQETRPGSSYSDAGRPAEPERRQLTLMFCDLVGSTALSQRLDPEDFREVIRSFQACAVAVIDRYQGTLAKYLGDGMLVYFGYPRARENDPERAIHTGLDIVGAVANLNVKLSQEMDLQLSVRIGIHTGIVVAGEMGGGSTTEPFAVVGTAPNVAARLEALAEPDSVVISAETHRLVEGMFECSALGPQHLKGLTEPVEVYRADSATGVGARLNLKARRGLTALVGREEELNHLLRLWVQIYEGETPVVLIKGGPGFGKSHLVAAFVRGLGENESKQTLICQCSPYHQNSALYPFIDLVERLFDIRETDAVEEMQVKLEAGLSRHYSEVEDVLPRFCRLLSVPPPEGYGDLKLTPQEQRTELLDALALWLLRIAVTEPVLLIVEDLHWIDPTSLELLDRLIDRDIEVPVYFLMTHRPTFKPPWMDGAHVSQITLGNLSPDQTATMVEAVAGGKQLPSELCRQIIDKTDGIPIFVEELTKMLLESELLAETEGRYELTGPLPKLAIPATLRDSLTERLDRLSTAKELAQIAAVLGREFDLALLEAVANRRPADLAVELNRLVDAELLYQTQIVPPMRYAFKHALIQDAAYQSLLRSKRQHYHRLIASVMEENFPDLVKVHPELVAHHYSEARLTRQAVSYWQIAGDNAAERSANREAIAHLDHGLELVKMLTANENPDRQELELLVSLGAAQTATLGHTAPEVEQTYSRARDLSQNLGDKLLLSQALSGLYRGAIVRGQLRKAQGLGEELLGMAKTMEQNTDLLLEAERALGTPLFFLGKLEESRKHLARGVALYDRKRHRTHRHRFASDPAVVCSTGLFLPLWLLGYPNQALEQSHKVIKLANSLSHPFSMAHTQCYVAWLYSYLRDWQAVSHWSDTVVDLASEQGFDLWHAVGTVFQGAASAKMGAHEAGISRLRLGIEEFKSIGAAVNLPHFLSMLAEALVDDDQFEEGMGMLDEALETAKTSEERCWDSELHRLKGTFIMLRDDQLDRAEPWFHQAIEIARGQEAKSLELRTLLSLYRFKRTEEVKRQLQALFQWFAEGLDSADLVVARSLLDEEKTDA